MGGRDSEVDRRDDRHLPRGRELQRARACAMRAARSACRPTRAIASSAASTSTIAPRALERVAQLIVLARRRRDRRRAGRSAYAGAARRADRAAHLARRASCSASRCRRHEIATLLASDRLRRRSRGRRLRASYRADAGAATSSREVGSHRGSRAAARLRQLPDRDSPVPPRQRRRRSAVDHCRSACARRSSARGCSRRGRCRSSPAAKGSCASRTRWPRTKRICAATCSTRSRVARSTTWRACRANVRLFEIGSVFDAASRTRCRDEELRVARARDGRAASRRISPIAEAAGSSTSGTRRRCRARRARRRIRRRAVDAASERADGDVLWDDRRRRRGARRVSRVRSTRRLGGAGVRRRARRSAHVESATSRRRASKRTASRSSVARRAACRYRAAARDAGVGVRSRAARAGRRDARRRSKRCIRAAAASCWSGS